MARPICCPRVSNLLPSMRAGPRTRPLQMFAVFRRGFHRCHADVCRRWSMGRPGGVRAFPSLAGNVCRHPPSPPVVGMFSFPAAPLTTFFCGGAVVLAVVRLHSAGALCCAAREPTEKINWGDLDWWGSDLHMLSFLLPFLPLPWLSKFVGPFGFICLVPCTYTHMPSGDAIASMPVVKLGLFGRLAGGSRDSSS